MTIAARSSDPVLNPHEVAEELGRNYETILAMLVRGDLAGVKRGRRWYVRRSAVDDFLDPSRVA